MIDGATPDMPEDLRHLFSPTVALRQLLAQPVTRKKIQALDPLESISFVSCLLVVPSLHANTVRIEALVHLLLGSARGKQRLTRQLLYSLLNEDLSGTFYARLEDPIEDTFTSNVITPKGNRVLLEGLWESGDYYLQRLYNVMMTLPENMESARLVREVDAILKICEEIATRQGLHRYQTGGGEAKGEIALPSDREMERLRAYIEFSDDDFRRLGIESADIRAFVLPKWRARELPDSRPGASVLYQRPIVRRRQKHLVVLPSSLVHAARMRILEWTAKHYSVKSFNENLAIEYLRMLTDVPLFGSAPPAQAFSWTRCKDGVILLSAMAQVDKGRFCHLIAVVEGFVSSGVAGSPDGAGKDHDTAIERLVEDSKSAARRDSQFAQGLTIIVPCGLGLGGVQPLPIEEPDWWIESVSAPDYAAIMNSDSGSSMLLWKMLEQVHLLRQYGLAEIVNPNGLLNLFAYWKTNSCSLLPSGLDLDEIPTLLAIPTDCFHDLRKDLRLSHDIHAILHPDGRHKIMRRKIETSYFPTALQKPLYASALDAVEGRLLGVWQGEKSDWWVQVEKGRSGLQRDTTYRIWDMATSWLERIVPPVERVLNFGIHQSFEIAIDIDQCSDVDAWGHEGASGDPLLRFSIEPSQKAIRIFLDDSYMSMFNLPENTAERMLVRTMVRAVADLLDIREDQKIEPLVAEIVPDTSMRHFHAFTVRTFREAAQSFSHGSKALMVDRADESSARLGLAWGEGSAQKRRTIVSRNDSVRLLNDIVDKLFRRIKATLERFNREATILAALQTIESVSTSALQWQTSSRALLSIYKDDTKVSDTIARELSKRKASSIALRTIVEIALQESRQVGGGKPGTLDLVSLMADALLLFQVGGMSDAIHREIMSPELSVAANGDLLFEKSFYDDVLLPFGMDLGSLEVRENAARYESNFGGLEPTPNVAGLLPVSFETSFREEFGASIDDFRFFRDSIENHALARREPVLVMFRSQIVEICKRNGVDNTSAVESILEHFTLAHRGGFSVTPPGFRPSDWYPWRFRRRLSLISRPIIRLSNEADSPWILSPGLFGDALQVIFSRYYRGEVHPDDAQSPAMKAWLSGESSRRAHAHVLNVARTLEGIGLNTVVEKGLSELLREKADDRLGDVDVLAWRKQTGIVYAIECKDLLFAKTATEIAEQLRRFSGQVGSRGEKDDLLKHLERCSELQKRSRALATNLSETTALVVKCVVCFSSPVAIKYVQSRFPSVLFIVLDDIAPGRHFFD